MNNSHEFPQSGSPFSRGDEQATWTEHPSRDAFASGFGAPDGQQRGFGDREFGGTPGDHAGHGHHGHHGHHGRRGPRMGFGAEFPDGPRGGGPRGFGRGGMGGGFDPRDGGFGPQGGGRRGPGRGRKGDVRAAIIALLGEQPMNGYQLINAIAERSSGLWSPSAGSVYPALGLLEDEGLIAPVEEDGKKLFQLTDAGREYATEHAEQVTAPWDRVAGPHKAMLDLRPELHQLGAAVQQLATTGEKEQMEAAREILVKARQNVYRLLAGDTPQD